MLQEGRVVPLAIERKLERAKLPTLKLLLRTLQRATRSHEAFTQIVDTAIPPDWRVYLAVVKPRGGTAYEAWVTIRRYVEEMKAELLVSETLGGTSTGHNTVLGVLAADGDDAIKGSIARFLAGLAFHLQLLSINASDKIKTSFHFGRGRRGDFVAEGF